MFLKNQRTWNFKPLDQEMADMFVEAREKSGIAPHLILPHGPYLVNLGCPNKDTREKSRNSFVDDLRRYIHTTYMQCIGRDIENNTSRQKAAE
jgi:endonuclease IV